MNMATLSILFMSALVSAGGPGCAPAPSDTYPELTDPADTILVLADSTFRIVLEVNPSTGYSWEIQSDPGELIVQEGEPLYFGDPETAGMMGAGGRQVWTFRALSEGEGEIVFGLMPPGGDEPEETRSYCVSVN